MRKMKDSGIAWLGDIPVDWDIKKIKNIARRKSDKNMPDEQVLSLYRELGIVIKDERDDNFNVTSENTDNYKFVEVDDIVVNKMKAWQGSIAVSPYQGIVSPAYYVYRFTNSIIYPRFVHYVLRCKAYLPEYRRLSGGIRIGQWDLSDENFKNIPLPLPKSFVEQKRIADYLDAQCSQIDNIISTQEAILEKLKDYRLSLITEAVTKGLNPNVEMKNSGINFIGFIPSHWKVLKFGYCINIKSNLVDPNNYKNYPQVSPESIEKGSAKLLNYQTVAESGVISWNHLFYKGQIIYSKIRPLLDKVIIAPFDGLCSADMYPIETNNDYAFIQYLMLSNYFHSQVALVTENRVKMPKINQNELSEIMVALPPIEEQTKISAYIFQKCSEIDNYIEKGLGLIEKYKEIKSSMIYEVVTGKKEV